MLLKLALPTIALVLLVANYDREQGDNAPLYLIAGFGCLVWLGKVIRADARKL